MFYGTSILIVSSVSALVLYFSLLYLFLGIVLWPTLFAWAGFSSYLLPCLCYLYPCKWFLLFQSSW